MKCNAFRRHCLEILAVCLLVLQATGCQLAGTANVGGKTLCVDPHLSTCYDTIGHALYHAADGDTIQISANVYSENLYIQKSVNLTGTSEGPASGIRTVIRGTLTNAPVVHIKLGATVGLNTLEITGGQTSNVGGAGILNNGTLNATDVIVDHNTALGYGGGIFNTGVLNLVDSLVQSNAANGQRPQDNTVGLGGGIYNHAGTVTLSATDVSYNTASEEGGGIYTDGDLTMTDGNISHNFAKGSGGGLSVDHGWQFNQHTPVVRLERVTIDNNAVNIRGGGIFNMDGSVTLMNVTLSGNKSLDQGGAILNGTTKSSLADAGTFKILSSTIADNSAKDGQGGGIADYSYTNAGPAAIYVTMTILAYNNGGNCTLSGPTTWQSWDYNLSDDDTCNLPNHADRINTNPKLNPLALNAPGRVKTHALQTGSPADNLVDVCAGTDARGVSRGQPLCDAGAYEGTVEPFTAGMATALVAVNATCRSGPGTGYAAVGYLNAGESHTISGRNPEATWLKLETCWVAAGLLETEGDLHAFPVLETPPLPTPSPTPEQQTSCSGWSSQAACTAAGCTWKYTMAGPGFCK